MGYEIKEKFNIKNVPSVLYGEKSDKVFLFVHGKCGFKEEAGNFAEFACLKGWQVLGIDLPSHGEREDENTFDVWHAVPELKEAMAFIKTRWSKVAIRANSIGAYFSMLAFKNENIERCLFVSPILDMELLIKNMMFMSNVSEEELKEKQEIETEFGETLSWNYLQYARNNQITKWNFSTSILYGENDNLTSISTVNEFAEKFGTSLEVMKNGEHWFHTPEEVEVLNKWTANNLQERTIK